MELGQLSDSITAILVDVTQMVAIVAPLAIVVMGIALVWKTAINFFKGLTGESRHPIGSRKEGYLPDDWRDSNSFDRDGDYDDYPDEFHH